MVDKVKPLKYENSTDGSQDDEFMSATNPAEDYLSCKGVALENSDNHRVEKVSNEVAFTDPVNNTVRVGEFLKTVDHRPLDELVHNIAETSYREITRDGDDRFLSDIIYTDSGKTTKIREVSVTRTSGRVTQVVTKQYDSSGVLAETYTEDYTRVSGQLDHIDGVLS